MKSSDDVEMSIGELAAKFDLATHVLRHWESVGLLSPATRVSGRRRYRREHVRSVALILIGKQAGFTLEEIRALRQAPDARTRHTLLETQVEALRHRMALAEAQLRIVQHGLECRAHDYTTCPNFIRMVDGITADAMRWPTEALPAARSR